MNLRTPVLASTLIAAMLGMVGCSTTSPNASTSTPRTAAATRDALNAQADAAMAKLYTQAAGSRELVARSAGYLVCPAVVGASLGVGLESGRCVLRPKASASDYYRTTSMSVGLQAGAQSKAIYYVFMNSDALNKFRESKGWSAGADANIAVASAGANVGVDTLQTQPVIGYVLTNGGLEAGVSMQGTKFTREEL